MNSGVLFVCAFECYDLTKIQSCIYENIDPDIRDIVVISDVFKNNVFSTHYLVKLVPSRITYEDIKNLIEGGCEPGEQRSSKCL